MTRNLLTAAAVSLALASCGTGGSYTITGTLPDSTLDGKTAYLNEYMTRNGSTRPTDSTAVNGNTFTFRGRTNASSQRFVSAGKYEAGVIVEPGTITIDLTTPRPFKVSGTPLNDSMAVFVRTVNELTDLYDARIRALRTPEAGPGRDSLRRKAWDEYRALYEAAFDSLFTRNPDNALGGYAFWRLSASKKPGQLDSLYALLGPSVRQTPLALSIMEHVALARNTEEGKPFVDFKGEDTAGNAVSLSDYAGRGKYVLADFWASWCGPCREGIPEVARIYEKYKDRGLEVVGVAVWEDRRPSLEAVKELGMTWPQIVGVGNIPTKLYGIEGIPHLILFAPDGTILARGLKNEELDAKIGGALPPAR